MYRLLGNTIITGDTIIHPCGQADVVKIFHTLPVPLHIVRTRVHGVNQIIGNIDSLQGICQSCFIKGISPSTISSRDRTADRTLLLFLTKSRMSRSARRRSRSFSLLPMYLWHLESVFFS
jgi:hypothetical protein